MKKLVFFGPALGLLAACGSDATLEVDRKSFAELQTEYDALTTSINASSSVDASTLPSSDQATYTGVFYQNIPTDTDRDTLGQAEVVVDFGTDTLDATVSDLHFRDLTAVNGTLTGSGTISRVSDPDISMSLNGTLTENGNTHVVSNSMTGGFFGAGGQYMEVNGSGTMVTNGGPAATTGTQIKAETPIP